ncbi:8-oxoguanine DNA glycosylase OGG fold protein, partial [Streptomyces sp. NPDC055722]
AHAKAPAPTGRTNQGKTPDQQDRSGRRRIEVSAYWALNNDQHIPYLGAAFFTKVLYFAGHDSPTGPYRPVILDSVVSQALKDLKTVDADWPENGWTTDQYSQYLEGVHELA